jgi:hypothetical protein
MISQYCATQLNRLFLLLLVATGLIGAALLNGLPSITCYALADAYKIAIVILGMLFIFELVGVIALGINNGLGNYPRTYKIAGGFVDVIIFICIFFCVALIYLLVDLGSRNIQLALDHCLLGDTPQKQHDRIPLYRDPNHPDTRS